MSKEPSRVNAGVPTGGRFAKTARSENVPALAQADTTIRFEGSTVLSPNGPGPLSALPASVGTPEGTFSISDAGKVETHVKIGGSAAGVPGLPGHGIEPRGPTLRRRNPGRP